MNCSINSTKHITRQHAFQRVALALCVIFLAASLLSVSFISAHTLHRHDNNGFGGSCAICAHLSAAENLMKHITAMLLALPVLCGCLLSAHAILYSFAYPTGSLSFVSQKIKLNN